MCYSCQQKNTRTHTHTQCQDWIPLQTQPVDVVRYFNVSHDGMVYSQDVYDYVLARTVHA